MDIAEYSEAALSAPEDEVDGRSIGWSSAIVHIILFSGVMLSLASAEILGHVYRAIVMRQIGYSAYVLIMLIFGLRYLFQMDFLKGWFLMSAALVGIAVLLTPTTYGAARFIDMLAAPSFVAGVCVFFGILPYRWADKAERIIVPSLLIQIMMVILSLHVLGIGTPEQRNALSAYSGLGVATMAGIAIRRGQSLIVRLFCATAITLFSVVLFTAFGRTSIIACAGTMMLVIWFGSTLGKKFLWLSLIGIVVVAVGFLYGPQLMEHFVYKGGTSSAGGRIGTLTGRTSIWETGLEEAHGILWQGKGRLWIGLITGKQAHSSYFEIYFAYGIFALWGLLTMCGIGLWAAIKTLRFHRYAGDYPLAPFFVIFFVLLGLTESYFDLLLGGFGALFCIGCGQCLLDVRRAKEYELLAQIEQEERSQQYPVYS